MKITELNNEELKTFLNFGLPENVLRAPFLIINKLSQSIKGFRPEKAPKSVIVQQAYKLIDKEHTVFLIDFYERKYSEAVDTLNKDIQSLIDEGYEQDQAFSKAVSEGVNDEFLLVYFKLEEIDEKTITNFYRYKNIFKLIDRTMDEKMKSIDKSLNNIETVIKSLKKNTEDIKERTSKLESESKDNIKKADYIKGNEHISSSIKEIQNKQFSLESQINELKTSLNNLKKNKNDDFDLKKELEKIKTDLLANLSSEKQSIKVTKVQNDKYDKMDDEYFYDYIGDVIESFASDTQFDVLREYLVEIIFSNKPIITSEKNSIGLARVLSSIITGGNYYLLNLSIDCDDFSVIEEMQKLPSIDGNKVFLIKNKINVSDHSILFDYIKSRPFNEKYIFEILFEQEITYLPKEMIGDVNFFLGNIDVRNIQYKYSNSFADVKRQSLKNGDFDNLLKEYGLKLFNSFELMNVKYYGLLSFSIIPFLSLHDHLDKGELLSKIIKKEIREKCEAVVND